MLVVQCGRCPVARDAAVDRTDQLRLMFFVFLTNSRSSSSLSQTITKACLGSQFAEHRLFSSALEKYHEVAFWFPEQEEIVY